MTKECLVCGNVFCKKVNESKRFWETKKYCSRACSLTVTSIARIRDKYSTKGSIPWNFGMKYSEAMKKRLNISGLAKGHGLFRGQRLPHFSGANHPRWIPRVEVVCAQCGNKISKSSWELKGRTRIFCNRDCWALGTRDKGSPVFKGELSTKRLRNRIMELPEYVYWRKGVMLRDGFKCVLCSSTKQLEVDHIKTFALIVRENSIGTTAQARSCKELWDQSNGRTLCKECHRKTDSYFKKLAR